MPGIRLLLLFAALLALVVPAQAQEPEAMLEELYAGFPHAGDPPGDPDMWTRSLRKQWAMADRRIAATLARGDDPMGEGLTFNVLNASQEDYIAAVEIGPVDWTEGYAEVEVLVDNGGDQPVPLVFEFVLEGDWKIADIRRAGSWRLTDLLAQTR